MRMLKAFLKLSEKAKERYILMAEIEAESLDKY